MAFVKPASWTLHEGIYILPEGPLLRPISSIHEARRFESLAVLDSGDRLHIILGRDFRSMDNEFNGDLLAIALELASYPYIGVATYADPTTSVPVTADMIGKSTVASTPTAVGLPTTRPTLISDPIAVPFSRDSTTTLGTHVKGLFSVLHSVTAGRGTLCYRVDDPLRTVEGALPQLRSATAVDTNAFTPVVKAGNLPATHLIGRVANLSTASPGAFIEAGFLTTWFEFMLNLDYTGFLKAVGEHLPHADKTEVKERHASVVEKLTAMLPVDFLKRQARVGLNLVIVPDTAVKSNMQPGLYLIKARCSRFYKNQIPDNYTDAYNGIGAQFWGTGKRTALGRYITIPGPLVRHKTQTTVQYATRDKTSYTMNDTKPPSLTPSSASIRCGTFLAFEDDVDQMLVLAPTHIANVPMVRIVGPLHPAYYTDGITPIKWTEQELFHFVMAYPRDDIFTLGTVDGYPATVEQQQTALGTYTNPDNRVGIHATVNATHGIDVVSLAGLYNALFSGTAGLNMDSLKAIFPFLALQLDKTKWNEAIA